MAETFLKIGIIGTGLMGGSLALAIKSRTNAGKVAVFDICEDTMRKARELGIGDETAASPAEAAEGSDIVFLATPVGALAGVIDGISEHLKEGVIVTDLGSAKLRVTTVIEEIIPRGVHYIGGHPMTGSEQSGISFARAELYRDCYYILTPTENTDADAFHRLQGFLTDIGARVISMDPESHDRAMATVSHVPHLLSLLLMDMANRQRGKMKNLFTVAAGGFRDMTRIAAGSPDLWVDICRENREFIVAGLNEYGGGIAELIELLERGDFDGLRDLFEGARRARNELSVKAGTEIEELFEVSLPVPDEPGVISGISTAVGALGVNIEDIGIVHPLEGETGILSLKILGQDKARRVSDGLEARGYRVSIRRV